MRDALPDTTADETPDAFFLPLGDGRFRPTTHAQGAWSEHESHMAPVSGLMLHELETRLPRPDLALSRVAFDILGKIPAEDLVVRTRVLRAGRTIELSEVDVAGPDGRSAVRATVWRLQTSDTSAVAGVEDPPMDLPGPEARFRMGGLWNSGFIRTLEVRTAEPPRPGRSRVWLRSSVPLFGGPDAPDISATARLFGLVDTANGVAVRALPSEVIFPNVDLTIHLHRDPVGEWLGLDVSVSWGVHGIGVTSAVLHDLDGPFGRSEQSATIRLR
ncbi:thioesterase family protein [Nakamurella sp. YIM 132087]|uniref:Thioesterase family protein n=1 Tax=Nakamurella alba TaxID=2665158 RepID=A0A7K1FVC4_9ACTN|nr:thioesterase family protein [Nakamurella alba]